MPTLPVDKIHPERILKELRRLWVDLGKQEQQGVLRACAMTLVALVDDDGDAAAAGELIAALMHEHPSRAIVVRMSEATESALSAQVLAQCWMPFGRRQQICCEQVEIKASRPDWNDLPSVLGGLLVPDLPVVIYSPSKFALAPELGGLLPYATKLIVNTCTRGASRDALEEWKTLATQTERTTLFGDLAWGRTTPWRQSMAQIFDEADCSSAWQGLTDISVRFVTPEPKTVVYYLAGWFNQSLRGSVKVSLEHTEGVDSVGINGIEMKGTKFSASLRMVESGALETRIGKRTRLTMFPEASDYDALRQELNILGPDPVFERSLHSALQVAGVSR